MKIAIGSDGKSHLTDVIVTAVKSRGYEVALFGALVNNDALWPKVAHEVALQVATGSVDGAILFCWTGTGITIAANKIAGIRAALCADVETARGARLWNNANILTLSLRALSEEIAKEILDVWFETAPSDKPEDLACFNYLKELDAR